MVKVATRSQYRLSGDLWSTQPILTVMPMLVNGSHMTTERWAAFREWFDAPNNRYTCPLTPDEEAAMNARLAEIDRREDEECRLRQLAKRRARYAARRVACDPRGDIEKDTPAEDDLDGVIEPIAGSPKYLRRTISGLAVGVASSQSC